MAKIQVKVNEKTEEFNEYYITIPGPGDVMIRMTESEARKLRDDLTEFGKRHRRESDD